MASAVRRVVFEHLRGDVLGQLPVARLLALRAIDSSRNRPCDHASGPGVARSARTHALRERRVPRPAARSLRGARRAAPRPMARPSSGGGSSPSVIAGTFSSSRLRGLELLPAASSERPSRAAPARRARDRRPRLRVRRARQCARRLERLRVAAAMDQEVRQLPQVECAVGAQRAPSAADSRIVFSASFICPLCS